MAPLGGLSSVTSTNYKSSLSLLLLLLHINSKQKIRSYSSSPHFPNVLSNDMDFIEGINKDTECSLKPTDLFSFSGVSSRIIFYKISLGTKSNIS